MYAPKEALEEKGNVTAEEEVVIEGKKAAAEDEVAAEIEAASATENEAENVLAKPLELNFGRPPTSFMIKVTQRRNTDNVKSDITVGSLRVAVDFMKTMGDNLNSDVDIKAKADFELDGHWKPEITSKLMVENQNVMEDSLIILGADKVASEKAAARKAAAESLTDDKGSLQNKKNCQNNGKTPF